MESTGLGRALPEESGLDVRVVPGLGVPGGVKARHGRGQRAG